METTVTNLADLKTTMAKNQDLQEAFKQDPVEAINNVHQTPLETDIWIYRIVVIALGFAITSIIIGVLILIGLDHFKKDSEVPTILTAIGSAAIGALSGLLAPSPKSIK